MNIDLFRDPLAQLRGKELYYAIEEFAHVSEPPADRTPEGYLVDFKQKWSDSALKTVAAFANTFGGVLVIGVSEVAGRADQLLGVSLAPGREMKTAIAGAIAANISPTPSYELGECWPMSDPTKHFCVVRVRKGDVVHLITKKGEQPVYVRNEDQSIPADSSRLQALLSRVHHIHTGSSPASGQALLEFDAGFFYVSRAGGPGTAAEGLGNRVRSETFLRIVLAPEEALALRLDALTESEFEQTVTSAYPELNQRRQNAEAISEQARGRDYYQLGYLEDKRDYHMLWLLRSNGEVHFASQVAMSVPPLEDTWSLVDVITHIDSTIAVAHETWRSLGYFGEGRVLANLMVPGLSLLTTSGGYSSAFYSIGKFLPNNIVSRPLTRQNLPRTQAFAEVEVTYHTRTVDRTETLAHVVNQLVRGLGYGVNFQDLKTILRSWTG